MKDPDELLDLPHTTLQLWQAYYRLEPWGESAQWYRHARLMSLLYHRTRNEESEPVRELADFIPTFGTQEGDDAE